MWVKTQNANLESPFLLVRNKNNFFEVILLRGPYSKVLEIILPGPESCLYVMQYNFQLAKQNNFDREWEATLKFFGFWLYKETCACKVMVLLRNRPWDQVPCGSLPGVTAMSCLSITSGCSWRTWTPTGCAGGVPAGTYKPWYAVKKKMETTRINYQPLPLKCKIKIWNLTYHIPRAKFLFSLQNWRSQ